MINIQPLTPDTIAEAVERIKAGELIVFPTDTVYGMAAWPFESAPLQRLYEAKQRPHDLALPVLIANVRRTSLVSPFWSEAFGRLAKHFWPGALTIVIPKLPTLPPELSPYPTVGVRVPDHDGALDLLEAAGGALATTSANLSGEPPAVTAEAAAEMIGDHAALILDGGESPGGTPSTVVELRGNEIVVLREGDLSAWEIRRTIRQTGTLP
jgi:L-threonylcarbamoyladenylate synthase